MLPCCRNFFLLYTLMAYQTFRILASVFCAGSCTLNDPLAVFAFMILIGHKNISGNGIGPRIIGIGNLVPFCSLKSRRVCRVKIGTILLKRDAMKR